MPTTAATPLQARQRRFVDEFMIDLNATKAAIRSGINLSEKPPAAGSYVYLVLCPEREGILYVGKGKGRRMFAHVAEAKTGRISGVKKFVALKAFVDVGQAPIPVVFASGLDDSRALALERALIRAIGLDRLCNSAPGNSSVWERELVAVESTLSRIRPEFDQHPVTCELRAVRDRLQSIPLGGRHEDLSEWVVHGVPL